MTVASRSRQTLIRTRRGWARLRQSLALNPDEQAVILMILALWLLGLASRAFFAAA